VQQRQESRAAEQRIATAEGRAGMLSKQCADLSHKLKQAENTIQSLGDVVLEQASENERFQEREQDLLTREQNLSDQLQVATARLERYEYEMQKLEQENRALIAKRVVQAEEARVIPEERLQPEESVQPEARVHSEERVQSEESVVDMPATSALVVHETKQGQGDETDVVVIDDDNIIPIPSLVEQLWQTHTQSRRGQLQQHEQHQQQQQEQQHILTNPSSGCDNTVGDVSTCSATRPECDRGGGGDGGGDDVQSEKESKGDGEGYTDGVEWINKEEEEEEERLPHEDTGMFNTPSPNTNDSLITRYQRLVVTLSRALRESEMRRRSVMGKSGNASPTDCLDNNNNNNNNNNSRTTQFSQNSDERSDRPKSSGCLREESCEVKVKVGGVLPCCKASSSNARQLPDVVTAPCGLHPTSPTTTHRMCNSDPLGGLSSSGGVSVSVSDDDTTSRGGGGGGSGSEAGRMGLTSVEQATMSFQLAHTKRRLAKAIADLHHAAALERSNC
jgi:hypothetical protein